MKVHRVYDKNNNKNTMSIHYCIWNEASLWYVDSSLYK
jgi:hypothetical protein